MVDKLIKHGADIESKGGIYGSSLHAAVHLRYDDVAEKLLAHGARPTDDIAFCFVEGFKTQCRYRFVDGELRPLENPEEDSYSSMYFDRVGEEESRSLHFSED